MRHRIGLVALCALGLFLAGACNKDKPTQTQSQEINIFINPSPLPQGTITGVTTRPSGSITLTRTRVGDSCVAEREFEADVTGTGEFYKRVTWSYTPITDGVSLTATSEDPPKAKFVAYVKGTFALVTTSNQDYSKKSTTVTVTVVGDCNGGGGPTERPVIHLRAEPDRINRGSTSTLIWDSERCDGRPSASDGWSGSKAVTDREGVRPNVDTPYTLSCSNSAGEARVTVVVRVSDAPADLTCGIDADPRTVNSGGSSRVFWSSNGVSTVPTAGFDAGTTLTVSGDRLFTSMTQTRVFGVRCTSSTGQTRDVSVTVTVTPPPQQTCPTGGINYSPAGGTAYVNRNTSVSASTPSPWPSYCQIIYYTDRPSIIKVLGADAVYEVCNDSGTGCVWYYAGRNGVITGVAPGTANIFAAVIQIGTDNKWRLVAGGSVSHTWTVTNPTSLAEMPDSGPMPKVYSDPRVSQTKAPWFD